MFSILLLVCYEYYANPSYPSSTNTKIIYNILAFVMSNLVGPIEAKIRIFIYAINFFEFIPEIRKIVNSYSKALNKSKEEAENWFDKAEERYDL